MAIVYRKKNAKSFEESNNEYKNKLLRQNKGTARSYFDEGNGVGIVSFCHDVSVVIPLRMTSSGLASV